MDAIERLAAIEAIKQAKARYLRGVDTADTALVTSVLADDCVLDYRGCCTDPKTGIDHMPAMNVVLEGAARWTSEAFAKAGIVSVHQTFNPDIDVTGADAASAIWPMTDRLFLPNGARLTGYGYYHETYARIGGAWRITTLRISRLRVEMA